MTDIRDKGLVKNVSNKFVDDNEGSLLRESVECEKSRFCKKWKAHSGKA